MISSTAPEQTAARRRRVELAAVAGMTGAALFVSVFTVYGWLYPGYSATSMFVSELSLGAYGWIQVLNFVLTGALVLMFGRGLAAHFSTGAASRTGPVLVQGIGVSLIASGAFTTDPSAMFGQTSARGRGARHPRRHRLHVRAASVASSSTGGSAATRRGGPWPGRHFSAGCCPDPRDRSAQDPAQRPESGLFEWKGLVNASLVAFHGLDLRGRMATPPAPALPVQETERAGAAFAMFAAERGLPLLASGDPVARYFAVLRLKISAKMEDRTDHPAILRSSSSSTRKSSGLATATCASTCHTDAAAHRVTGSAADLSRPVCRCASADKSDEGLHGEPASDAGSTTALMNSAPELVACPACG